MEWMELLHFIIAVVKFVIFFVIPLYQTIVKFCMWIVAPMALYLKPSLIGYEITKHSTWPYAKPTDLNKPKNYSLPTATDHRVQSATGTLGVWDIPAAGQPRGTKIGEGARLVILYCHGNTENRGKHHRILLYKVLTGQEFHVVAFDYRGYGDSDDSIQPREETMVFDALTVYEWADSMAVKDVPFFIWGHSLGTGVAARLTRDVADSKARMPIGLVLEAPYYHIQHLVRNHKGFKPWFGVPFYEKLIISAIPKAGFWYRSCDHVEEINAPILIFHADDDYVVTFELGFKLYQRSKKRKNNLPREFYGFVGHRGFGHSRMCDSPEMVEVFEGFLKKCLELRPTTSRFPQSERRSSDTMFFGPVLDNMPWKTPKTGQLVHEDEDKNQYSKNADKTTNENMTSNRNVKDLHPYVLARRTFEAAIAEEQNDSSNASERIILEPSYSDENILLEPVDSEPADMKRNDLESEESSSLMS